MSAFRLDKPHSLEEGDAVVDVDDELVRGEVEREFLGEIPNLGPAARGARRPAQAAEELGVRREVKPNLFLRSTRSDVDVRPPERRLELEIQVEVRLADRRPDLALLEKGFQPFVLFRRED